jgi:hypothetical protein
MNEPDPPSPPNFPGYAVHPGPYQAARVRHTSHARLFMILGVSLTLVVAVLVTVAWLIAPPTPKYTCDHPPACGRPPVRPPAGTVPGVVSGPPVPTGLLDPPGGGAHSSVKSGPPSAAQPFPRAARPVYSFSVFRSGDGAFTVEYPPGATVDQSGVSWRYNGGQAVFLGVPARNRTAREIAETVIQKLFPSATIDYPIPNAMVGYQPGYGEIDNVFTTQSGSASYTHLRVLAMVAVKHDLALIAFAVGPYHKFTQADVDHPSGANLEIAMLMGPFVNSFRWTGDPPR